MSTKDSNGRSMPYNGWANYETWNVAQWLTATPDGVLLWCAELDLRALDDLIRELP